MEIILASQSPARKKLLQSLGVPFKVIHPKVDEAPYQSQIKDTRVLCQTLARLKAQSIQQKQAFVIGCDQMAHLNGQSFGKPKTKEKAIQTLKLLQGKTHELISALCIQKPDGSLFENVIVSHMTMRSLTQKQIENYLDKDRPYQCAGSYTIEGLGISLFEKIQSPDFNAIIGLPLISLCSQLTLPAEAGV